MGAFTSAESMTVISDTINKMGLPKEVAQGLNQVTAATLGALVGGAAGAASGLNVEANNRQLHPDETKWIQDNASRYAEQKGISEAQAITRLAQQAYRQVQAGAGGTWDADASAFLGQAHGMLAADPNCPTCGPGYMFYATPDQKANPNMYAEQLAQTSDFYAKNGLTLPTPKQISDAVQNDAALRNQLSNATAAAAGVAGAIIAPPVLSWCLSNPVACNQVAVTGGEIVAGDALGPAGLGAIGITSAVKAVRSADEVNTVMKARGWEPAWASGTPVIETTLQPGTKVNMIIDAEMALAISQGDAITPGGWATFDNVTSVAADMRQRSAITNKFKPNADGPFYVVEMEITQPVNSSVGFVGKQTDITGGTLFGGGTQIQFDETITGKNRNTFLKIVSDPKALK